MNVHLLGKKIFRITQMAEGNAATLIPVHHKLFKMIKDTSLAGKPFGMCPG
jgi:hypothetical protein